MLSEQLGRQANITAEGLHGDGAALGGGGGVVNEYPVVDLQWQKNFPNPMLLWRSKWSHTEFT